MKNVTIKGIFAGVSTLTKLSLKSNGGDKMYHYTIETDKTTDEAIKALEENLTKEKFGVLWSFNIKDKLQAKGLEFDQDFYVLEVCNPFDAHEVLTKSLLVGYFLPCKIVVYNEDGKTKMGMVKPSAMIGMLEDNELSQKANDIEQVLMQCMGASR